MEIICLWERESKEINLTGREHFTKQLDIFYIRTVQGWIIEDLVISLSWGWTPVVLNKEPYTFQNIWVTLFWGLKRPKSSSKSNALILYLRPKKPREIRFVQFEAQNLIF